MTVGVPSSFSMEVDVVSRSIRIVGELDVATAAELIDAADLLGSYPGDVVVEFRDVTFVDSSGLNALITLHNRLTASGGRLRVVGAQEQASLVFKLGGLTSLLG